MARSSRRSSAEPVIQKVIQRKQGKVGCNGLLRNARNCVSQCWSCFTPELGAEGCIQSSLQQVAYLLDRAFSEKRSQALMMIGLGFVQVGLAGLTYSFVWKYDDWEDDPRQEDSVVPFFEGVWHSWTFMADPGTHAPAVRAVSRLLSALITLGGIFFFACVLGFTVEMFLEKMETLRQGKSKISESNHILLLGWTQQSIHIIEELCLGNESEGGCVISVLAENEKEFMESELALQLPTSRRYGTRIIIRRGSPLLVNDLLRVGAHRAKAVVILAPVTSGPNEADANTVRAVLSLKALCSEAQGISLYSLAEVRDIDNEPLLRTVCDESVEIVVSHDMIGRLMVMSVRQPGLAKVYEALLGFEGDEFYMQEWPEVVGQRFGDLQFFFPDAVPIGILTKLDELILNPGRDRVVEEGEQIVVIAEDRNSYWPEDPQEVQWSSPPDRQAKDTTSEKILICGWRRDVREVLKLIDKVATPGSEVHMITHCVPVAQREKVLLEDGFLVTELVNIRLVHHFGNTSVRRQLDKLPIESFTSGMIFAESAFEEDTMYADSHSLATLLLLRDIQVTRTIQADLTGEEIRHASSAVDRLVQSLHESGAMTSCPVVCEILSPQTQATISASQQLSCLSDFCQTNKLIAQVMAMITEERTVRQLLDQLLGCSGTSIAVVPSSRYAHEQESVSFFCLAQRASSFGEVLIGYQVRSSLSRTVLNPGNKHKCLQWEDVDFAILQSQTYGEEKYSFEEEPPAQLEKALSKSTAQLLRGASSDEDLYSDTSVQVAQVQGIDTSGQGGSGQVDDATDAQEGDMQHVNSDMRHVSSVISLLSEGANTIRTARSTLTSAEGGNAMRTARSTVTERSVITIHSSEGAIDAPDYDSTPRQEQVLKQSLESLAQLPQIPELIDDPTGSVELPWKAALSDLPAGERKKMRNSLSVMQEALSLADGDAAFEPSHDAQRELARIVSPGMSRLTTPGVPSSAVIDRHRSNQAAGSAFMKRTESMKKALFT